MICGLMGYARSGKNTLADLIQRNHEEYKQIAFADALRAAVYHTNPIIDVDGTRVQDAVDRYGYEGAKSTKYGPEMRRLMQAYGTDGVRNHVSDSAWVDVVVGATSDGDWIINDCRFPSEIEAVRREGGTLLWVHRPGVEPANAHSSENSVSSDDADYIIYNHGTPADMMRQFNEILASIG